MFESGSLSHLHLIEDKTAQGLLDKLREIKVSIHGLKIHTIVQDSKSGMFLAFVESEALVIEEVKENVNSKR